MTYRQRKARRKGRRGARRNPALLAVLVPLLIVAAVGVSAVGYVIAIAADTPPLSELKPADKGQTSVVFAADGSRLGYVRSDEIRTPIPWSEMPPAVREATVAIEDERFYEHEGVDFSAIIRAGVKNLESGDAVQGGSTITQQLVRALYIDDPERTFERKIREAKLAQELEDEHPGRAGKNWILREYLNSVPYGTNEGRTAIGVQAAARSYFDKHAHKLELHEAALLAGLPQAPSQYNPFRNPTAALERRNEVLQAMAETGFITLAEYREASTQPLGLDPGIERYTTRREPYFFDYVEEQLIEEYGVGVYRRGGLKIHTTIDPDLQEAGRAAINGALPYSTDPSSAIVAIDPSNGYIRAMASSGSYGERNFNLAAQGHRQPGSAFKTFVLVTALRQGVDPNSTTYTSKPLDLDVPGYGPWKVSTYDDSYGGTMDLVRATLRSDNSVFAQLDIDLGPENVKETAELMGIETQLDGIPAEGLGGLRLGVSPLEMANAYATLSSYGVHNEPIAITEVEFPDGKVDELGKPKRKRVLPEWVAHEATKILEMNVTSGTGTAAQMGCPAAGKTGTTDNFNDAWFVGYTPHLAASVWVGYPNALVEMTSVHGISVAGGTFPAQIWQSFMSVAKGADCDSFREPVDEPEFTPFYGEYASTGTSTDTDYSSDYTAPAPEGPGDNSAGGDDYSGYDPRLYESPPQEAPETGPPPAEPDDTGGASPPEGRGDGDR
ncbi:MAG TPA: transglycosylase domain-containing protein [Thermoleophilaceae bacterium]|nr:transglycosylase domain-containing protein [Thermoleophilaceae bacterium]